MKRRGRRSRSRMGYDSDPHENKLKGGGAVRDGANETKNRCLCRSAGWAHNALMFHRRRRRPIKLGAVHRLTYRYSLLPRIEVCPSQHGGNPTKWLVPPLVGSIGEACGVIIELNVFCRGALEGLSRHQLSNCSANWKGSAASVAPDDSHFEIKAAEVVGAHRNDQWLSRRGHDHGF